MAKSLILLLFLLFNPMKSGLDHLSQEAVFPFKLSYQDICDPMTISSSSQYNHHYLFQQFFLTLNDKNELDVPKALTPFQIHKNAVLQYLQELQQYETNFLNSDSVQTNSETYFRKKLHYVGRGISSDMELKLEQMLPIFQNNLDNVSDQYVMNSFIPFYEQKFRLINDLEFFFEEAKKFTESEIQLGKDYFKPEICGIKALLFQVIDYFTKSPPNQTSNYVYNGDRIPIVQKDKFIRFFKTYYPVNTDHFDCFQQGGDQEHLFLSIMKLIFTDDELQKLLQEKPEDTQNFGPSHIAKIQDPNESSPPGIVVGRDIYLLEFLKRKNDDYLDLEYLGIIRGRPSHFSIDFFRFLNKDVPKEIQEYQDKGDLPKDLGPNEYPDILYTIYVDLRSVNLLDPDYSKEVPDLLRLMLQQIKQEFFDPKFDNNDDPNDATVLIADRPKIRNNLPAIIRYIKLKLGIDDEKNVDDEDNIPEEQVIDIIEQYGGLEAVNDFVEKYSKVGKPKALKKAGDKILTQTFQKIDLDEELFSPYKNKEDEGVRSRPMIDDEEDNELPQVTEVKKKLKNTIQKLIPKKTGELDNGVQFFTEKIFEKIDSEDPVKNNFWTEIVIRTINDKEKEMDDLVKKQLKNLLSMKLLKKIQGKVFNVPGFINFMRYQINYGDDINYQQIFPLSKHFTFANDKARQIYNAQVKASYTMFLSDIAIFYMFVQRNERLKSQNAQNLFDDIGKHFLRRAGVKSYDEFNKKIVDSNLILQQYHGLSFFFEFIRVFHLFDSERFDKSEASIQNIGTLFWKMYKFVMLLRVRIKKDIADPIGYAIKQIRLCAERTYLREGEMNFNRSEALCQEDYSDYIKMELFLKYYVYNLNPTEQNKEKFFNFDLRNFKTNNEKFMIVESTTFHKFMDTVQGGQANMDDLCQGYEQTDLCLEASMRKQFILIMENNPVQWNMINDKIIIPYQDVLNERKYLFWNLMEIVERLDNFKFEQFLRRIDDSGLETEEHNQFVEYLYVNDHEIDTWVAQYLRLNFSHYSLHLQNLAQAIDYIISNDMTNNYLTHGERFNYNSEHDIIRQFHFANVRLFLYLGHKKTNYAKLGRILKNHTWMVILFKKMVDKDQDQFIKDVSEHIKSGSSPADNAQRILEYINKKYEDIKPHTITEQDIFSGNEAYDFLAEDMEDDLDMLDDLENESNEDEQLMGFNEVEPKPAAINAVKDYLNENYLKELQMQKENKKVRGSLRNTNQKIYKEVIDADKGSLMDVLKKVFDHVKQETGREEIMESDMDHVNQVLSTNKNVEQSQQLRQVFEDALKDGNVITFENIGFSEIQTQDKFLV